MRQIPDPLKRTVAYFASNGCAVAFLLFIVACQTTPLVYLPDSLQQKFFGVCGNSGSVAFKLFRHDNNYLVSGFIDWDTNDGMHISNVMGSTIAVLKHEHHAVIQLPNAIVKIAIDANGRLSVNGSFSGLYLDELHCLLGGRLPISWHQDRVVATAHDYRLTKNDSERKIIMMVGVQRFRVELARRILWLFTSGELIAGSYRRQTGYLAGHGFRLNWEQLP